MSAVTIEALERYQAGRAHAHERPWYIGFILGAAGWLAGIFLLGFVMLLFKPDSSGPAMVIGIFLFGAAWCLFRVDRDGTFMPQLALALSIAAQVAVLFGAFDLFFKQSRTPAGPALVAFIMQAALVFLMPNRLHRSMSTLFACAAWAVFLRYTLFDSAPGASRPGTPAGPALLGWAIAWAPVAGILYDLVRREPRWMAARRQSLARPVATGLILALAVGTLLSQPVELFEGFFTRGPGSDGFALWPLLSTLAAVGALFAAFSLGLRGLAAVCILAALLHMSHFYYAMGASLLVKSAIMIAIGAALLGVAYWMRPEPPR